MWDRMRVTKFTHIRVGHEIVYRIHPPRHRSAARSLVRRIGRTLGLVHRTSETRRQFVRARQHVIAFTIASVIVGMDEVQPMSNLVHQRISLAVRAEGSPGHDIVQYRNAIVDEIVYLGIVRVSEYPPAIGIVHVHVERF